MISVTIISIALENMFNIFFNIEYFYPLFTLMSLIFLFYKYKDNKNKYFIISFLIGFIYDIFFTNFYILNSIVFLICSFFIYYILYNHKNNYLLILVTSIFIILLYNILIYLILEFFQYIDYNLIDLSMIISNFLLLNIIYITIVYFITKKIHIIKN